MSARYAAPLVKAPAPSDKPAAPQRLPLAERRQSGAGDRAIGNQAVLRAKRQEAAGVVAAEAPAIVHDALRSGGSPLDAPTRAFFEPRFGADFSAVRLHTDATAAAAAASVQARAYTVGRDIVFAADAWRPADAAARHLLAHELAHVSQQTDGTLRRDMPATPAPAPGQSPPQPPPPVADPAALAAEISTLLHTPDPIGGMRTDEAMQKLSGRDAAQLLAVLQALRARDAGDPPIVQQHATSPLIAVVAETVSLQAATGTEPEVLARYRARVQQLPQPDQAVVIAAFPTAAVPADPVVPATGLVPPPGAPTGIPDPLLATLNRSYARRQAGLPGSDQYLANAFWGGRPADIWQALKLLGPALDVMRRVYARWTAAGLPWSLVDAIYNTWAGTSDGFDFACPDPAGLTAALKANKAFCEDHVGGLYHFAEGTTPCWREIIDGAPGLHVCTGGNRMTTHIDAHQVVSGSWPGGFCSYNITGSVLDHFRDLGWW